MGVRLGNLSQVHSEVVLVPEDQDVWIEFKVLNWDVKLNFQFDNSPHREPEGNWAFEGKGDHGLFILYDWREPTGIVLQEPYEFGNTEGRAVYAMFACYAIGPVTKLEVQFYIGALRNEY